MTPVDRYTFGDREHVALRMVECIGETPSEHHFADQDEEPEGGEPELPAWLMRYVALRFLLVFWLRLSDPQNDWKGPREDDWQHKTYIPTDYREGMQVGVKLGTEVAPRHYLLDVDLDWVAGIQFAPRFLPRTGFVFGRASKPLGHAFYTTSTPVVTKKFTDIDGTTIVELRGTKADGSIGLQTALPPSMHRPSGEVVTQTMDGDIAHDDAVPHRVALYAVACFLGRHWPKNGPDTNQHDTAAYAAGFLCRRGVDLTLVPVIVEVAATLGGDDNVRDRVRYAQGTVEKFRAGDTKLAGGPKLAKEVGEAVVARLREWLPVADQLAAAIERLNKRFAIVSVANKVVVMDNLPDGSIKTLWPFDEFKKLLSKERIKLESGDDAKVVPLAPIWITHKDGRRYESLVYDMPGSAERCGPDDYNGWLGFTVAPKAGDWSKNKDHILTIICRGLADLYAWLFNWMAALVQFPGRHAFTSIVLRGGEGVGKGHLAHLMLGGLFYKQQYLHIIGAGMLTGQFNEHLSGKVLVFADESTWGGDLKAANKLKGLVTESTVPIERKFLPIVEEPSCLHIIIASNDEWPVAIPKDDRRFTVFDVAEDKRQDDAHFTPLRAELANGGLAAMLHDLLQHKIDESALRHPPSTTGKQEVMLQSLKPIERWWYEKLATGTMSFTTQNAAGDFVTVDGWPTRVAKAVLHEDYHAFLDKHRETRSRRSTETELGMFLSKLAKARTTRENWELQPLEECRACWVKECGWPKDYRWPEDEADEQRADRNESPF